MSDKKNIVLYHDDPDGWCSMYCAWTQLNDNAKYISVQYGEAFPIEEHLLTKDLNIFILDFSYSRELMIDLNNKINKLVVIDHHSGQASNVAGLDFVIFDVTKSGALLSWEYFNPNDEVPEIVKHVNDYDLYKFELENTRAIDLAIRASSDKHNPYLWKNLIYATEFKKAFLETGKTLLRDNEQQVKSFASNPKKYKKIMINGYVGVIYNTTTNINQLAEAFYNNPELNLDFSLSYFFLATGEMVLSFRSDKVKGCDVSEFARLYSGNGHRSAAGGKLNIEEAAKFLIDVYKDTK